jgi:hypothetical protein
MDHLAVLGPVAGLQAPARAGLLFDFSYDIPNVTGGFDYTASGVLTTTDVMNPDGSYTITGITGTRTAHGITDTINGLTPPGSYGFNNNELFLTGPYLDFSGLTFTIDNSTNGNYGTNQGNVFFNGESYTEEEPGAGNGSFTISPLGATVPEPSSLLMTSIGGLMALGIWRRRRRAKVAA